MDLRRLLCSAAPTPSITQVEGTKEPLAILPPLQASPDNPHTTGTSAVSQLCLPPTSVAVTQEPIRRVAFSQNQNLDSIGTSTWQSRNPRNSVLLPRIRANQRKSDAEKASLAARSSKRKEKATDLEEAIQAIIDNRDVATQELAKIHSVSVKSLAKRVNASSNYLPTRGPNVFNALVSLSSIQLNEGWLIFTML
jgi:hypothetical protein